MFKRGQLTMFMIIGMVLILITGGVLIFRSFSEEQQVERQQAFEATAQTYETYMQSCVDDAAEASVDFFGLTGGNFNSPAGFFMREGFLVSYLHEGDENYLPTLTQWESYLEALTYVFLQSCDVTQFEQQANLFFDNPSAKVQITDQQVLFTVNLPATLTKEGMQQDIATYHSSVPVRLSYFHDAINTIIKETIKVPGYVPATPLLPFFLNITAMPYPEEDAVLYTLKELDVQFRQYTFVFADKNTLGDGQ